MKLPNDSIYRALNKEKPDKQRVLGQALAEMEAMPKVKRVPRRRLILAWGSAVALLLVILIPIVLLAQTGMFTGSKSSAPADMENAYDAPQATPDQSAEAPGFRFELSKNMINSDESSAISGAEGPLASYDASYGGEEESVIIYSTTNPVPSGATQVFVDNLSVDGWYIVRTEDGKTYIDLYLTYQSKDYLIVICAEEERLDYFLSQIRG